MAIESVTTDGLTLVSIERCCESLNVSRGVLWNTLDQKGIPIEYTMEAGQRVPGIRIDDFMKLTTGGTEAQDTKSGSRPEPPLEPVDPFVLAKQKCAETLKIITELEAQTQKRDHEIRDEYQGPLKRQDEKIDELLRELGRRDQELGDIKAQWESEKASRECHEEEQQRRIQALEQSVDLLTKKLEMAETVERSLQNYTSRLEDKLKSFEDSRAPAKTA